MKIMIIAGGTGGHLYPGIAVARALGEHDILFVVRKGDLCKDILKGEGFAVREIAGQGVPRSVSAKVVSFPFAFIHGWIDAWRVLRAFHPDGVLGMGGYLSFPVVILASMQGVRTLIHEQNVVPGLANRFLSRWSRSVAVSFAESQTYFPAAKTWVSGLPVREEMGTLDAVSGRKAFDLDPSLPTLLVFGGSLGAKNLNHKILDLWGELLKRTSSFQVLHVTGQASFKETKAAYEKLTLRSVVLPYCNNMASAYAAADWVICRAGASTVAELAASRRPSTLIPYPFATNNHQQFNAQVLKDAGVADVISERELDLTFLAARLEKIINDPKERSKRIESFDELTHFSRRNSQAAKALADFISGRNSQI